MGAKKENIVRYTTEELQAMAARGEVHSDWEGAAQHPLPDGSDPDDAMEEVTEHSWVTTEMPDFRKKTQLTLRLDADVLDWFRAQGLGYQTRINAVLRTYYEAKRGK